MKLFYCKIPVGNFGDDLNVWLWPKFFPGLFDNGVDILFVGFGTIFDTRLTKQNAKRKVVFGAGVRSLSNLPQIDDDWDIRFVRGPLSAQALRSLRSVKCRYITDSSFCLGLLEWEKQEKKHHFGFVPHYRTANIFNCKGICRSSGLFYIDPRGPAEKVIKQIRSCKMIIAESMHGAIIADLFRIPWLRVKIYSWQIENAEISALKWLDFGLSLGVDTSPFDINALPVHLNNRLSTLPFFPTIVNSFSPIIVRKLDKIKKEGTFRMSPDHDFDLTMNRLNNEINRFQKDYPL